MEFQLFFLLLHLSLTKSTENETAAWYLAFPSDDALEYEECENDMTLKYDSEINPDDFLYKICLVKTTRGKCSGVFVEDDILFLHDCHGKAKYACCRGSEGIKGCEPIVREYYDSGNKFAELPKKRKVMDMIWDEEILEASDCATFGYDHRPHVATVSKASTGYNVSCGCEWEIKQDCLEGDVFGCDGYIAGIVILVNDTSKLVLFRSRYLNTVVSRSNNSMEEIETAPPYPFLIFVSGSDNLSAIGYLLPLYLNIFLKLNVVRV
ncbi:hypothetical protein Trydic_g13584 [Trypoxylus dichotomus]